jgi:hypothetical protein
MWPGGEAHKGGSIFRRSCARGAPAEAPTDGERHGNNGEAERKRNAHLHGTLHARCTHEDVTHNRSARRPQSARREQAEGAAAAAPERGGRFRRARGPGRPPLPDRADQRATRRSHSDTANAQRRSVRRRRARGREVAGRHAAMHTALSQRIVAVAEPQATKRKHIVATNSASMGLASERSVSSFIARIPASCWLSGLAAESAIASLLS